MEKESQFLERMRERVRSTREKFITALSLHERDIEAMPQETRSRQPLADALVELEILKTWWMRDADAAASATSLEELELVLQKLEEMTKRVEKLLVGSLSKFGQ